MPRGGLLKRHAAPVNGTGQPGGVSAGTGSAMEGPQRVQEPDAAPGAATAPDRTAGKLRSGGKQEGVALETTRRSFTTKLFGKLTGSDAKKTDGPSPTASKAPAAQSKPSASRAIGSSTASRQAAATSKAAAGSRALAVVEVHAAAGDNAAAR